MFACPKKKGFQESTWPKDRQDGTWLSPCIIGNKTLKSNYFLELSSSVMNVEYIESIRFQINMFKKNYGDIFSKLTVSQTNY